MLNIYKNIVKIKIDLQINLFRKDITKTYKTGILSTLNCVFHKIDLYKNYFFKFSSKAIDIYLIKYFR